MALPQAFYAQLIKEAAEQFIDWCKEDLKTIYDEIVPMILIKAPPDQRRQVYDKMDWGWLMNLDPDLYVRLSQDSLDLQEYATKRTAQLAPYSEEVAEPVGIEETEPVSMMRFAA